jgi:hypothetical protein
MPVSWQEFRKLHKGTPQREISDLWKRYKQADYDLPPSVPTSADESDGPAESYLKERSEDDQEKLTTLETAIAEKEKQHTHMIFIPEPVAPEPSKPERKQQPSKRKTWKKVSLGL